MPHYLSKIHFTKPIFENIYNGSQESYDYFVIPVFQIQKEKENVIFESKTLQYLNKKIPLNEIFYKNEFKADKDTVFFLPENKISFIFVGSGNFSISITKNKNLEYRFSLSIEKSLKFLTKKNINKIIFDFTPYEEIYAYHQFEMNLKSLLCNILISFSNFTYHSLEAKEIHKTIENLIILTNKEIPENIQKFIIAVMDARSSAMDLVNTPSNLKTTNTMVNKANSLKDYGLKVEVIEDINWIKENMPCFYTVSLGSLHSDPPKWIKVQYTPDTEIKQKIALIGKSIIFDTGGYQVKPDNYMNTMKADMTGGASVLSIIEQIAKLKLPYLQITAYCAVTPNKIDSNAMLPDSIVTSACGKRVEIRHTDAEGRLTLIDAISHAEKDNNDLFIVIATLTGSAARAVGPRIALMSTSIDIRKKFEEALEDISEPYQSLEVEEEDFEDIKSKLDGADINNTGSEKYRGAQTAAAFVFSGLSSLEKPCLHLDIAGGDMDKEEKATGITIKGLMNYLYRLSQQ